MSVKYAYLLEIGCLLLRLRGTVRVADFKDAIDRAKADPDVPSLHLRFTDMRAIEGIFAPADVQQVAKLTNSLDEAKPPERSAILVGNDFYFGLARMFRAYRGDMEDRVNIFRDYQEALRWLGLPEGEANLFEGTHGWR